jgi:hypothetical protein
MVNQQSLYTSTAAKPDTNTYHTSTYYHSSNAPSCNPSLNPAS